MSGELLKEFSIKGRSAELSYIVPLRYTENTRILILFFDLRLASVRDNLNYNIIIIIIIIIFNTYIALFL